MRNLLPAGLSCCLLISTLSSYCQDNINITRVTSGKTSYRPVVKNNRVLWFDYSGTGANPDRVSVWLNEDGKNKNITDSASVLFTGWPDLDAQGNVSFMKKISGKHEVFLFDGKKEIRITNNKNITNSAIQLGMGSDKVICGYPRIHNGNIVFRDGSGQVYLYNRKRGLIKKVNSTPSQTANVGDDDERKTSTGLTSPLNAHSKYFEFDGVRITWMHEEYISENNSRISIFTSDTSLNSTPMNVASFNAWVPNNRGTVITKLWNPFFKACNGYIIWQYYLPGPSVNIDNTHVGFFDGKNDTVISKGTHVATQSVQVADGKALWWQTKKEGEGKNITKTEEIILYQNGGLTTVARYPEPPKIGKLNESYWEGILDAEIIGGDILWVTGETNCFQHFKMPVTNELYCMYKKTDRIAFFRSSPGSILSTNLPSQLSDTKTFAGGGEYNGGVYAFFSSPTPAIRDISTIRLFEATDINEQNISLIDRKLPDLKNLELYDSVKKHVIDAFSISLNSQLAECGKTPLSGPVELESITFDVLAEKKPTASLDDIVSLSIYLDENKNGKLDTTDLPDKLLGKSKKLLYSEIIFTFTGTGILLKEDEPVYFLVELELKEDICPCGKYIVRVDAEKLKFKKTGNITLTANGTSTGGFEMYPARIKKLTGDEQAELPGKKLPDTLAVIYNNLPVRCGKAKFKITFQPKEKGSLIISPKGETATEVILDLVKSGKDAKAWIQFKLGKSEGLYTIAESLLMPEGIICENESHDFKEHAGTLFVQLFDMNNPDFFEAVEDPSHPDYHSWKARMSSNLNALSKGGEGRQGSLADGASMLLIRAKLTGLEEPPKGDITVSISGNGNIGHLSPGVGENIPTYSGGQTVQFTWQKTREGIFGFALYTPPLNYGNETIPQKQIQLKLTYLFPGAKEPVERNVPFTLMKPPVAFIHGMWSNKETWGPYFTSGDNQFETHLIDYSEYAAYNFAGLGYRVKNGIQGIVRKLRSRGIAATRVSTVCHSMGGLITRQFFADKHGRDFFRKDNFGQGDIYKLVTLGTPHYGSPIAWITKQLRDAQYSPFVHFVRMIGLDIESGAIDGMCPGSSSLMGLGVTHIPSHTVRAWNFDSKSEALTWSYLYESLKEELKKFLTGNIIFKTPMISPILFAIKYFAEMTGSVLVSYLYSADKTDMLVTLESQSGGIAQGGNAIFQETIHFVAPVLSSSFFKYCETSSKAVATYIFDILNQDRNDINYYAPSLPKPGVQDPATTCK